MLLGLIGRARSGKDTFAGYLKRYGFERVAFADPIRDAVAAKFGIPRCHCEGFNEDGTEFDREAIHPIWEISVRRMLQVEGTEGARDLYCPDFWIRRMVMELARQQGTRVVVTDVRYQNEVDFIKKRGGLLVAIFRDLATVVSPHVSEAGIGNLMAQADYIVENTGALVDLEKRAERLGAQLLDEGA